MKSLISSFFLVAVFSCATESTSMEDLNPKIPSSISGKVYDFQRNIAVPNYTVRLIRQYDGFCGYLACTKTENISTVKSDENGNYSIPFNFVVDNTKEKLVYHLISENENGYIAEQIGATSINPGNNNLRNVNAWKPLTVKFNLDVKNCNNFPLVVATLLEKDGGTFNNIGVDKNGLVSVDLLGKPSASMFLKFNYFVNGNYSRDHQQIIAFTTTNSENQSFNFEVDCSKF